MSVRVTVAFSPTWNLWQVRVDDANGARIALETTNEREAERYAGEIRSSEPTSLADVPPQKGLIQNPPLRRLMQGDVELR